METQATVRGASSKMIPLALPKGEERLCELCQKRAQLQCNLCRVTFYCDAEHQQADWLGIHEKICPLLIPIRTTTILSLQRAGRIETQLKKAELIEICRLAAQRKLSERKHSEALPAAQFCLRCSIDVHGSSTGQLVPAYLLLAEANMGLGNLAVVADLLSQAEWAVLKSPECGHAVQQQLHRSLGHLYTATGNLETALLHFANDIYYASEEYGLDSTVTCDGYFFMADVFAKQGKMSITRSLYSAVAHTWHCHLTELLHTHVQFFQNPDELLEPSYDKGRRAEGDEMLRTMLEFEQDNSRKEPAQIALVAHCLAMLWFLEGDNLKALGFGGTALQASQLIPNRDLTEAIRGLLQLVQSLQTGPPPGSG
ncbi:zinc finger MYND domain-containing protein 12 isoform X2 [Scophthalmus maximus]|uniref:zinc finger MYND domain-containing protein 12 isoform X2 n=1 Tax=Scophthalmus maximus TaxID=52904 RepID=UPI0015E0F0AA|nr:zinc finger MYND domain-containing protein 12 isoform X2 [Scophthalmus maximus]